MILLFYSTSHHPDMWRRTFAELDPSVEFQIWPDWGDEKEGDVALVWKPPQGLLASRPSLKAIFSMGAGIDHLISDPELPAHLPLVRLIDPTLTAGMSEFVVMSVLYHHRDMNRYARQQATGDWRQQAQVLAQDRSVGILGMGVLGQDAALKLLPFGFDLRGWRHGAGDIEHVSLYHGNEDLGNFLDGLQILVNLLPLTAETEGILNAPLFRQLSRGAAIINVARGGHLVDLDLLNALESEQISAATLDVFHEEPLPDDHPFWSHPKIQLTPHIASETLPVTAAREYLDAWDVLQEGNRPIGLVDQQRGY